MGGAFFRSALGRPKPARPPRKGRKPLVYELRFPRLRDENGRVQDFVLEGNLLSAAGVLTGEKFPLDALAEIFPEAESVAVLVDARAGTPYTRVFATRLARALVEMGLPANDVRILAERDEELVAGGYTLVRRGRGPFCHGTRPVPGYGEAVQIPGAAGRVRLSRAATPRKARRLAVVASLASEDDRMAPFVIDAALSILDEESRARALKDPVFGAKVIASDSIGGRIEMVLGDLVEVKLARKTNGSAQPTWRADEILAGFSAFAVERIGHRILSNTRAARGLGSVPPHPILEAAESLGLEQTRIESIDWRKGSL